MFEEQTQLVSFTTPFSVQPSLATAMLPLAPKHCTEPTCVYVCWQEVGDGVEGGALWGTIPFTGILRLLL